MPLKRNSVRKKMEFGQKNKLDKLAKTKQPTNKKKLNEREKPNKQPQFNVDEKKSTVKEDVFSNSKHTEYERWEKKMPWTKSESKKRKKKK